MPIGPSTARLECRALRRGLRLLLLAAAAFPPGAGASSLIVPDQAPTIQAALDAQPDTVLIRPGTYAESPAVRYDVSILRLSDASSDWVVVDTLTTRAEGSGPFRFRGLQIRGPVKLVSGGVSAYGFTDCDLQGGVVDNLHNYIMGLTRCRVGKTLDLWVDYLSLDSCQVTGGVRSDKGGFSMRGCTVEGWVTAPSDQNSRVEGCTIRGGGIVSYADGIDILSSLIEDCRGDAISIPKGYATITGNLIRGCAGGIRVESGSGATVEGNTIDGAGIEVNGNASKFSILGNTVLQSPVNGLLVGEAYSVDVIGNVFWMCAYDGVRFYTRPRGETHVRQNTSAFNGKSGFDADPYPSEGQQWTGNIGYGNGHYGFRWSPAGAATFSCNDWFGNQLGQVEGRPFSSDEFSVDPQFCDGPAAELHLHADSPLVNWAGCGLVGALNVGCGAVGVPDAPATPAGFALARVGPVPTRGPIAFEIALPRAAPIEVTVHDVQGRVVARLAGGEWSAGRHAIEWSGEGERGRVPQGLYLIRYRFPGGEVSRRVVMSR